MLAIDLLARIPALRNLARVDLEAFKILAPPVQFRKDAVLLRQGEPAMGAFLVVTGRCRVEILAEGRMTLIGHIGPGEVAGESGLFLRGATRSATVVAEDDVQAMVLMPAILHEPAVKAVMSAVERRALASLAERVRGSTSTMRRLEPTEAPPAVDAQQTLLGKLRRLWS